MLLPSILKNELLARIVLHSAPVPLKSVEQKRDARHTRHQNDTLLAQASG